MIGVGVGENHLGNGIRINAGGLQAVGDFPVGGLEIAASRIQENHVASCPEQQGARLELNIIALHHGAEQCLHVLRLGVRADQRKRKQQGAIAHHADIIVALLEGVGSGKCQHILGQYAGGDQASGNAQEFAAIKHEMF
jgi:hypothetical protein